MRFFEQHTLAASLMWPHFVIPAYLELWNAGSFPYSKWKPGWLLRLIAG